MAKRLNAAHRTQRECEAPFDGRWGVLAMRLGLPTSRFANVLVCQRPGLPTSWSALFVAFCAKGQLEAEQQAKHGPDDGPCRPDSAVHDADHPQTDQSQAAEHSQNADR